MDVGVAHPDREPGGPAGQGNTGVNPYPYGGGNTCLPLRYTPRPYYRRGDLLKILLLLLLLTATALTLAGCGSPFDQPYSDSPGLQTLEAEAGPTATATATPYRPEIKTKQAIPTATPLPTHPSLSEDCDPSYPTICLHPPPPNLDCDDIEHREFKVTPPDKHYFDPDGNGIGCEQ